MTKQMNHRRIQCLLCELAQECPYSSFLAKPGSGAGGGSGLSAGGGGSRSGVLYEDRPGLGRGGVSLGCSLRLGPRGEFGLGFFGAFGRMNLVSSLAGGGRICPAALGVMVLAFTLVRRSGVSMSITLPAGRRVLSTEGGRFWPRHVSRAAEDQSIGHCQRWWFCGGNFGVCTSITLDRVGCGGCG